MRDPSVVYNSIVEGRLSVFFQDFNELYSTPDSENILKKTWIATKFTGAAVFICGSLDIALLSKPTTVLGILGRYVYLGVPFFGMSTAFMITKGLVGQIRQVDGPINHGIGGMAAGAIFGVWRKSRPMGVMAAVIFGSFALLKKHCDQLGMIFLFPPEGHIKLQPGGARSVRDDYSLTKHRPGNWTTGTGSDAGTK